MMVGLMMGEHAGTVIEGTVREGIIRPIGTRGAFDIGPREERERKKKNCRHDISLYCLHTYCFYSLGRIWLFRIGDNFAFSRNLLAKFSDHWYGEVRY